MEADIDRLLKRYGEIDDLKASKEEKEKLRDIALSELLDSSSVDNTPPTKEKKKGKR